MDQVATTATIFSEHATQVQLKMPSQSKLNSLAKTDPRQMQALCSIQLLDQLRVPGLAMR